MSAKKKRGETVMSKLIEAQNTHDAGPRDDKEQAAANIIEEAQARSRLYLEAAKAVIPVEASELTLADMVAVVRVMAPAGANITLTCGIGARGNVYETPGDAPCTAALTFSLDQAGTPMPPER
jgi:hypothetical protein